MAAPLCLISQADARLLANGNLRRMLDSVAAQDWAGPVAVFMVLAHGDAAQAAALREAYPWLEVMVVPELRPLSVNRNIVLARLLDAGLPDDALVGFPDDDLRYPPGLLAKVDAVMRREGCAVIGVTYNAVEAVHQRFDPVAGPLTPLKAMMNVASGTMFMRGAVLKRVGLFDETLGLGSFAGGGEDVDFIIRALETAGGGWYEPGLVVVHPIKAGNPVKYYPGSLRMWVRHRRRLGYGVAALSLLKRLSRGLAWVAGGRLSPWVFIKSWGLAMKEIWR